VNRENLARLSPETIRVTHNYIPSAVEGAGAQLHPDFSADLAWAKQQAKPEFALVYPATALATMLTQRMQNDIGKELGSAPKLEPMEWKAYLGRLQGEAPALFYMGYSAPFNDAESHLKLFLADESDNRSHYSNPAYASLVAKIKKLPNGKARAQAIEAAQRLLVEKDVVVIPLLERQQVHAIRPELQGFIVNPYGVVEMRSLHW
jgi:oligopeptide transport system substrate-binding protein